MADTRVVQQGDHLSSIAADAGFANFHTIIDDGGNSDVAGKRDPHVLFPGDQLAIPDREDRTEFGDTDEVHVFQTDLRPLYLRCEILDINGKPVSAANCSVTIDSTAAPDVATNDKGIMIEPLGRHDKKAEVTVQLPPPKTPAPAPSGGDNPPADDTPPDPPDPTLKFDVKIGYLNPEIKLSGQQARLNNMGYFAGYTIKDLEQLLWAAEEFQCDDTKKQVKERPELVAAPPGGEDDASNADPDSKTGIQDQTLVGRLKTVHGI